jgi:hypothetical protein
LDVYQSRDKSFIKRIFPGLARLHNGTTRNSSHRSVQDSRQDRVNSWRDFKQGKKKPKKTGGKLLKPPKLNPEKRT